ESKSLIFRGSESFSCMVGRRFLLLCLFIALLAADLPRHSPAVAQTSALKLAAMISLGDYASYGKPFRDGVRLAVEEANRAGGTPIVLDILDDGGTDDGARTIATRLAGSDALAVVGPMLSTASLAAGPIFAEAGLVSIVSAVESDLVTRN